MCGFDVVGFVVCAHLLRVDVHAEHANTHTQQGQLMFDNRRSIKNYKTQTSEASVSALNNTTFIHIHSCLAFSQHRTQIQVSTVYSTDIHTWRERVRGRQGKIERERKTEGGVGRNIHGREIETAKLHH